MRQPNELVSNTPGVTPDKMRGGLERVARRFLPASPAATHIRLDRRRAQRRRSFSCLVDRRRVAS